MHQGNQDWLAHLKKTYPEHFTGASVLEIGSLEWNGSVRNFFAGGKYVGVDLLEGPGVDLVMQAGGTVFEPGSFDTLVCLSLFEHDPTWKVSFEHNLQWLREGGLAFVCWGAEGNLRHDPEPWAIVPVKEFLDSARQWPVEVADAFFEGERFTPDCPGCYDVVLRKKSKGIQKPAIDVCVVAYRSEEDLPELQDDLTLMSRHPIVLHLFDNIGNPKTLTMAWNDLAKLGSAPYLAFLNTDIRISPGWDERLVEALEASADAGVVLPNPIGHDWAIQSGMGEEFPRESVCPTPPREAMCRISEAMKGDPGLYSFGGACNAAFYAVLMKRSLFEDLKGFDERFRFYGQDHDFQRRVLARYGKYPVKVNKSVVWHRCGGSTMKAAERGEVDFNNELHHLGRITDATITGKIAGWDQLTDEERAAVRLDPVYGRMPRHQV